MSKKKSPRELELEAYEAAHNALDDEHTEQDKANITATDPQVAVKIRHASPMRSVVLDPAANKKTPS